MPILHVLRVFVNEDGAWGNPLGVFLDGGQVHEADRQRVAAELGFSETVYVDDPARGWLRIYTPATELPFAGHPLVGTAWLLAREGAATEILRPPAGEATVRYGGDGATFVTARPEWAPRFAFEQLASPTQVGALSASERSTNTYVWSWIDEAAGMVRARSFVPEAGIDEDEATGSAALALCHRLGCPLTIHQGQGSILRCRPLADGSVEVGGAVVLDEHRDYAV